MASIGYENLTGMNPLMTLVDPLTGKSRSLPKAQVTQEQGPSVTRVNTTSALRNVSGLRDTSKGTIDSTIDIEGVDQPTITAKTVEHYANAAANVLRGTASIANGYISKMSAETKAMTYNFKANQNRRAADLLLANQVDITRAAQMDAAQYKISGEQTKTNQVTAMAGSGFAVGKGAYKNTINTTEARINYNVANLMLKAGLENAELTRKAGTQEAEAIINDANAEIARKEGKLAVMNGWINGISNFISAGASFYCGKIENGALNTKSSSSTTTTKKS